MPQVLKDLKDIYRNRGARPKRQELIAALEVVTREIEVADEHIYIILDALDEVPRDATQTFSIDSHSKREELLDVLKQIRNRSNNVQIVASSRDDVDIRRLMEEIDALPVNITKLVERDVDMYVKAAVNKDIRENEWKAPFRSRILARIFGFQERYVQMIHLMSVARRRHIRAFLGHRHISAMRLSYFTIFTIGGSQRSG